MCHWILTADCEAIVEGYEAEISNNGVLSSPALYPRLHVMKKNGLLDGRR